MTARPAVDAPVTGRFTHRDARDRFGDPDDWEGSVNNPVTQESHGVRWNERWIYFLPDGERREIYWHRYACRAVLRIAADGAATPELELPAA